MKTDLIDDKELEKIVADIPGDDGWYKSDGEEFLMAAKEMAAKGFSVDDIERILSNLYAAVADEYGD